MKLHKISILIAIILTGFILRLLPINWGLPSKNLALTTYNPDEAISFNTLEKWKPSQLKFPPGQTIHWGNVHLFTLAAALKLGQVIGFAKAGNRDFYLNNLKEADKLYIIGRLISILAGTLSILLLFLIIRFNFGDELPAFISASILAIMPLHMINSLYIRPDILMMFMGLFVIYFSLKIANNGGMKYYILAGIFLGLTIATKYSGSAYLVMPLLAHLQKYTWKVFEKRTYFNKPVWIMFLVTLVTFIFACPYSVLSISAFTAGFKHLVSMAGGSWYGQFGYLPSWYRYLTWYLPSGMGMPLFIASIGGFFVLMFSKQQNKLFLLLSGIFIFILVTRSRFQSTWHAIPLIPFLVIYAGYLLFTLWQVKKTKLSIICKTLVIFVIGYTFIYSVSMLGLFLGKNVREEASDWIDRNIPKSSTIGIARSYFWTPPILRQYTPPYKVFMGGDPVDSILTDAIINLKNNSGKLDYIVISEFEYRQFLHPKLQKYFPRQANALKELMYCKNFKEAASFDRDAKFLWFTFRKDYPPEDWLVPNPKIIIYRKTS